MQVLGLDSSTQSLKAIVLDSETDRILAEASVRFGRDLPQFGCPDGFLPNPDPRIRHADPRLWLAALDLVFARLREGGTDLSAIEAIGGDGQQHGSVYLDETFADRLAALPSADSLVEALSPAFARPTAPIWMDSSTADACRALTERFGETLRAETGSPATMRFTGPQIMRFAATDPVAWSRTRHVHLVSSFLCSVLIGENAPVDTGDGAGMNLLSLRTGTWHGEIAEFTAPGLVAKLPRVGHGAAGTLSPYFARYGLRPGIPVATWTGDNPATLVGCGAAEPGCAVISLGTSDTFFAAMPSFRTDPDGYGNVFGNPLGGVMALSCFQNGSLARDRVRRELGVDWTFFDETAFEQTPPGNEGRRAFPCFEPEITPVRPASGILANFDYDAAPPAVKIRAVVEAQIENMQERTRWIGRFGTIYVAGGASRSKGLRDVIARTFGATVVPLDIPDAAALGSARLGLSVLR